MTATSSNIQGHFPDTEVVQSVNNISVAGATNWIKVRKGVMVHIGGTATGMTIKVERSTVDPTSDDYVAADHKAVVDTITGDAPLFDSYTEFGIAYYRLDMTVIGAGAAKLNIQGGAA